MLLLQLKEYIAERRIVSLQEMVWRFRMESNVLRPMLELLVKKGQIQRVECASCCNGTCDSCDPAAVEFYSKSALEM